MYENLCFPYHFNRDKLIKVEPLYPKMHRDHIPDCISRMEPNTFFVAEEGGIPEECTYHITVLKTENSFYVYNHEFIIWQNKCGTTICDKPTEEVWKQMFLEIKPENLNFSHYDYLKLILNDFWKLVFGKTANEMFCGGIITSHGDKGYGYEDMWKKAGIPFRRGMMLFLLSYTKEFGDRPKHETDQWVIENYPKYLPHLEAAEKEAGLL